MTLLCSLWYNHCMDITDQTKKMIFDLWEREFSIYKIAKLTGLPFRKVSPIIKKEFNLRSAEELELIDKVVKDYESGKKLSVICKEYGYSEYYIRQFLDESEVAIRPHSADNRLNNFDERYFQNINTEAKAYWLGFMFADGSVTQGRYVWLKLHSKDRGHIQKFLDDIGYSGSGIKEEENKTGGASYIILGSKAMVNDLIDKGCVPRKSLVCSAPNKVPKKYVNDFIRGVVDGDGHLRAPNPVAIEIYGAFDLVTWISESLEIGTVRPHNSIWRIVLYSKNARGVIDKLYSNATVFLERKKITADLALSEGTYSDRVLLTEEQKDRMRLLREEGAGIDELVEKFKCSPSTVYRVIRGDV